jgi:hypothetical protein
MAISSPEYSCGLADVDERVRIRADDVEHRVAAHAQRVVERLRGV